MNEFSHMFGLSLIALLSIDTIYAARVTMISLQLQVPRYCREAIRLILVLRKDGLLNRLGAARSISSGNAPRQYFFAVGACFA
jgi:hypothetical protein